MLEKHRFEKNTGIQRRCHLSNANMRMNGWSQTFMKAVFQVFMSLSLTIIAK